MAQSAKIIIDDGENTFEIPNIISYELSGGSPNGYWGNNLSLMLDIGVTVKNFELNPSTSP